MTWFRCASGGGSTEKHYATIAISTDDFMGLPVTVTCEEFGYLQTKNFDSLGDADFIVNDWGTYTIECEGFYTEVVVSEWYQVYSVDINAKIEITFDVEGAQADNITIYNGNGELVRNLIFSSGETKKSVTLNIPLNRKPFTFKSSVAKATDGSGVDYEKPIVLTETTTAVKVMPDKCVYWYGNKCGITWAPYGSYATVSEQTNLILVKNTNPSYAGTAKSTEVIVPMGAYSKLCAIARCNDSVALFRMDVFDNVSWSYKSSVHFSNIDDARISTDIPNDLDRFAVTWLIPNNRGSLQLTFYAVWLEE